MRKNFLWKMFVISGFLSKYSHFSCIILFLRCHLLIFPSQSRKYWEKGKLLFIVVRKACHCEARRAVAISCCAVWFADAYLNMEYAGYTMLIGAEQIIVQYWRLPRRHPLGWLLAMTYFCFTAQLNYNLSSQLFSEIIDFSYNLCDNNLVK